MKRSELLQFVDNKVKEFSGDFKIYGELVKEQYQKIYVFEQKILRFYMKLIIARNPDQIEINEQLGKQFNIKINNNNKAYTPYEFLVALRFFMRKIQNARKAVEECWKIIQKKTTCLETLTIELERLSRDKKRNKLLGRVNQCISVGKDTPTIIIPNNLDLSTTILELFNYGWQLERDNLIQLITLNDDFKNPNMLLDYIPDRINFPELYNLIVIDRIESFKDCYLFDALKITESKLSEFKS